MDLKELGLSDYESKAYQALIRHGKLSASHTSRTSEVPYGKIYEVLASLENKGLVRVIPEKTKMFAPTSPENLQKLIETKEKQLRSLRKEVDELKQQYDETDKEPVVIVKGKKNFYKVVRDIKKSESFSYAIKYSSEFNPEFVRNSKKARERGIIQKTLARVVPETIPDLKKWKKEVGTAGKEIINKGIAMSINDDETMLVLTNQNIIMLIRDRALCEVLKQLVDAYYDNTKEIDI